MKNLILKSSLVVALSFAVVGTQKATLSNLIASRDIRCPNTIATLKVDYNLINSYFELTDKIDNIIRQKDKLQQAHLWTYNRQLNYRKNLHNARKTFWQFIQLHPEVGNFISACQKEDAVTYTRVAPSIVVPSFSQQDLWEQSSSK
jgi:hypothetical protein